MTVEEYTKRNGFFISKSALERAVKNADRLEALALIRAACKIGPRHATLDEANKIYLEILSRA